MTYDISNYEILVRDAINYINEKKLNDKTLSILDVLLDFSFKNNISIDLLGDAISSDSTLKSFIEKDCELHKIFKSSNSLDW